MRAGTATLLMALMLVGCGGGEPEVSREPRAERERDRERDRDQVAEPIFETRRSGITSRSLFRRIELSPDPPVSFRPITVSVDLSEDAETHTRLSYTWMVNGRRVGGSTETLSEGYRVGDEVTVRISASEPGGDNEEYTTPPIEVDNATPQITTDLSRNPRLNGLTLRAHDPDGDAVSWELRNGPPGMTIDARRGQLRHRSTSRDSWSGTVEIAAVDPHGGEGILRFDVNLSGGREATTGPSTERVSATGSIDDYTDEQLLAAEEARMQAMERAVQEGREDEYIDQLERLRRGETVTREVEGQQGASSGSSSSSTSSSSSSGSTRGPRTRPTRTPRVRPSRN